MLQHGATWISMLQRVAPLPRCNGCAPCRLDVSEADYIIGLTASGDMGEEMYPLLVKHNITTLLYTVSTSKAE